MATRSTITKKGTGLFRAKLYVNGKKMGESDFTTRGKAAKWLKTMKRLYI